MADDLLINIEVDTKKGKKGVDDLTKSLKANAKQSRLIQKELTRLEKDYKSIATAAKKLPAEELKKLEKETKKVAKATAGVGKAFDKTAKRVDVVKERISDTELAASFLIITFGKLGNLDAPIKFANRIARGTSAVDKMLTKTGPLVDRIKDLSQKGFKQASETAKQTTATFKAFNAMLVEQRQLHSGVHLATVRTADFMEKLSKTFRTASSAATFFERSMREARIGIIAIRERVVRIVAMFNIFRDTVVNAGKTVSAFQQVWLGTFGAGSGGAAQVNKFQQLILELQFITEKASDAIRTKFSEAVANSSKQIKSFASSIKTAAKGFASTLIPAVTQFAKSGLAKAVEVSKNGLVALGPTIVSVAEKAKSLATTLDARVAAGFAKSLATSVQFGVGTIDLSQKLGVISKGLLGVIEAANIFGFGMLALGSTLKSSDNAVVSFAGSVIQLAGAFSLAAGAGLSLLIAGIGQLSIAIGTKLLNVMAEWEKAFEKAQGVTRAFEFVIKGFGRTLGTETVGSLQFWNDQVNKLATNTAIGADQIQKSVKVLIAEGAVLGISAEQNAKILERAADIAESSKRPLSEISLAFAKALAGTAGTLDSVGIFTDKATLAHSKYAHASGLVIDKLDKQQKAQLVMNSIFEQSEARVGAAADQLDTITGSSKQLTAALTTLQANLGTQNIIFTKLTQIQTKVVQAFNDLPPFIHRVISTFVDVGGVVLVAVGIFLTFITTIVAVKSAIELLNFIIVTSGAAQSALNFVIGIAANKLNVQTVAVSNLSTAMAALRAITVAGVTQAFNGLIAATVQGTKKAIAFVAQLLFTEAGLTGMAAKLNVATASVLRLNTAMAIAQAKRIAKFKEIIVAAAIDLKKFTIATFFTTAGLKGLAVGLKAVTVSMFKFTGALLKNPLFIKATIIIGGIVLVVEAIKQLRQELKQLQPQMEAIGNVTKDNTGLFDQLGKIMSKVFQLAVNLVKLALIEMLKLVRVVEISVTGWKLLKAKIFGTKEEMEELRKEGSKTKEQLSELTGAGLSTMLALTKSFEDTSQAATDLNEEIGHAIGKVSELQNLSKEKFSLGISSANISALGTAFENTSQRVKEAKFEFKEMQLKAKAAIDVIAGADVAERFSGTPQLLDRFIEKLKESGKETKELDKLSTAFNQAQAKRLQAQAQALAARNNAARQLADMNAAIQKDQLAKQKKIVDVINLETQARLAQVDQIAKGIDVLNKDVGVRRSQLVEIKKTRAAIIAQGEAAKKTAIAELKAANAAVLKKLREEEQSDLDKKSELLKRILKEVKMVGLANIKAGGDALKIAEAEFDLRIEELDLLSQKVALSKVLTAAQKEQSQAVIAAAKAAAGEKLDKKKVDVQAQLDEQGFINQFEKVFAAIKPANIGGEVVKGIFVGLAKAAKLIRGAFRFGAVVVDAFSAVDFSALAKLDFGAFKDSFKAENFAKLGELIFNKENLLAAGAFLAEGLVAVGDFIGAAFDPAVISGLADSLGNIGELPQKLLEAFDKLLSGMDKFISNFAASLDSMLAKMPEIIDKIFEVLPQLITTMVEGLNKFLRMLPAMFAQFAEQLPAIFAQIFQALPEIILNMFNAIGKIISTIIGVIPDILVELFASLPDIIESIIEGLISAMGDIVAAFVDFFIGGGLEKIVGAFIRMIPKIAIALVKGIVNGLRRALGSIFGKVKLPTEQFEKAGKVISDGFKAGFDKITGESSKLFAVKDFEEAAKGLDPAKKTAELADKVSEAFESGANLWNRIVKFLKKVWDGVIKFFKGFGKLIKKAWDFIIKFFTETLPDIFVKAWAFIVEFFQALGSLVALAFEVVVSIFTKVMDFFSMVFAGIVEKVFMPIVGFFRDIFAGIIENVWNPVVNFFRDIFSGKIGEAFQPVLDLFNTLGTIVSDAFKAIKEFWSNIFSGKITEAFSGIKTFFTDTLKKLLPDAFDGIIDKLSAIGDTILASITGGVDGLKDKFKGIGTSIFTGLKDAVKDGGKIFGDLGGKIFSKFKEDIGTIKDTFKKLGSGIFSGLKTAIKDPGKGIKKIFTSIFDALNPGNLLKKLFGTAGEDSGKGAVETIIGLDVPFVNFARGGNIPGTAKVSGDSLSNDVVPILASPGEFVVPRSLAQNPAIAKLLQSLLEGKLSFGFGGSVPSFKDVTGQDPPKVSPPKGGVLKDISEGDFGAAGSKIKGGLSALDPIAEIMERIKEALTTMMESQAKILRGKDGGLVGGFSSGDGTPSLLQPGEFVVNRTGVRSLGLDLLGAANQGRNTGGNVTNIEVALDIQTTEPVDETFVRNRLMPAVKEELKQSSLRGDFLISSRGIRS